MHFHENSKKVISIHALLRGRSTRNTQKSGGRFLFAPSCEGDHADVDELTAATVFLFAPSCEGDYYCTVSEIVLLDFYSRPLARAILVPLSLNETDLHFYSRPLARAIGMIDKIWAPSSFLFAPSCEGDLVPSALRSILSQFLFAPSCEGDRRTFSPA